MQLSLLDDQCDSQRIGFVSVTWQGQRLALMLSLLPSEQSQNPQQAMIQTFRLEIKSTSKEWIEALRKQHMESFVNSISGSLLHQA